jgi:phosphatidylglycerophosphate synthase
MNTKMRRLWATKTKDDEWWSSFVTAPLGLVINYVVIEWPWVTPNRITAASFALAILATICILWGGIAYFITAAFLIQLSHVLDCMDGQLARYRKISSAVGSYFDRLTDQVQVALWFGAVGIVAYIQSSSVMPVILSLIGITFYGLRGYSKYIAIEIETTRNVGYPEAMMQLSKVDTVAGLGFGFRANLLWFVREQLKVFRFDEGVLIFMLSTSLLFNQLIPMLWIFATSQLCLGVYKCVQRGRDIHTNHQHLIQK